MNNKQEPKKASNKSKNKKKRLFITLFSVFTSVLVLFCGFYCVLGSIFFRFGLDATFASVAHAPKKVNINLEKPEKMDMWFEETPKATIQIKNKSGYMLSGYEILASDFTHIWVISVHGYRGSAKENSLYAYHFNNLGYNVVLPDLAGHGKSEGKFVGMGYNDRQDILLWIDYILEKDTDAKIVLHGVSMGAATVMMTTGESLPDNVICAIEDCGYTSVYNQFKHVASKILNLPLTGLILSSANFMCKLKLGYGLRTMDCVSQIKKSKTPTLFIHGDNDNFVPFYMLEQLYNANPSLEKEKLVIKGANHACCATKDKALYFSKVKDFIEKYANSNNDNNQELEETSKSFFSV